MFSDSGHSSHALHFTITSYIMAGSLGTHLMFVTQMFAALANIFKYTSTLFQ